MASNQVDVVDVAPLVILPIAAGMVLGVWSFGVDIFGGYDFAAPLWTVGGSDISMALLISVGAIAAIVGTNEIDGSNYESHEYAVIAGALVVVPAYVFIPAVASLVDSHDMLAFGAWTLTAIAATAIAYWE